MLSLQISIDCVYVEPNRPKSNKYKYRCKVAFPYLLVCFVVFMEIGLIQPLFDDWIELKTQNLIITQYYNEFDVSIIKEVKPILISCTLLHDPLQSQIELHLNILDRFLILLILGYMEYNTMITYLYIE